MAETSDTLLTSLNDRISRLERENAELRSESKKHRLGKKSAAAQAEQLQAKLQQAEAKLTEAAATPSTQAQRLAELEGQLRRRDHADAFREAVGGTLHPKASIDDLWAKIQYTPGEAVPTPDAIRALAAKAREAAPYLFAPEGRTAPTQPMPAATPPAWAGRGSDHAASSGFAVTDAQLRDPAFMLAHAGKLGG